MIDSDIRYRIISNQDIKNSVLLDTNMLIPLILDNQDIYSDVIT